MFNISQKRKIVFGWIPLIIILTLQTFGKNHDVYWGIQIVAFGVALVHFIYTLFIEKKKINF
mgnify:CR=1 FL=1